MKTGRLPCEFVISIRRSDVKPSFTIRKPFIYSGRNWRFDFAIVYWFCGLSSVEKGQSDGG